MFRIINHSSFFFQMSTKRKNRGKVQCQECEFVLISDQQETHQRTKHAGQKVKFQIFPGDSKQRKVSAMFSAPPIHCGPVCNVTDPTFTVTDLINSDCEFRVFAENSVGQSEPSLCSNLMKVQELSDGSAPEFVRGLQNVSVGLGKTLSLEMEVSGRPKPLYYIHDISLRFSKNFISNRL